ncbi:hypothetical protein, partial [Prochlorococcus sp. MIT 1303]|uniref:hypothetical protein n=1 Tax=Prochlorococcus sp. MIT 1303 TaxID=1723647 RepID=UPI000A669AD9
MEPTKTYNNLDEYSVGLVPEGLTSKNPSVIVQDRDLSHNDTGTDILSTNDSISFGSKTYSLDSSTQGNYLFSSHEYLERSHWIDVDGNIALHDGSIPTDGMQGNQAGDDIIIGFDRVDYWSSSGHNNYSIARLEDDQGDYLLVQDRDLGEGNQGTDIIRDANYLYIYNQDFSLDAADHNYLFDSYQYTDKTHWIDVDGNIALHDGSIPTDGMQGNQAGDDIIIGFDRVDYWSSSGHNNYSIARLEDDQGDYLLVQDRDLGEGNQGTDIIRDANYLYIYNQDFSLDAADHNYLFDSYQYTDKTHWIDVDGNIALHDGSIPTDGMQGNQAGDDIIIGFDRVDYTGSKDEYSIQKLQDSSGYYYSVEHTNDDAIDANQGNDIIRNANGFTDIVFDDEVLTVTTGARISTPTYALFTSESTLKEGEYLTTNISTEHVALGTELFWQLEGDNITQRDLRTGHLSGSNHVDADGNISFSHSLAQDLTTEGLESFIVKLFSDQARQQLVAQSTAVEINDTSTTLEDGSGAAAFNYKLFSADSIQALDQLAVLGQGVDGTDRYRLEITGQSLTDGYNLEGADITLKFNPQIFQAINASDIQIGTDLPLANAVHIDNATGAIRIAASSLSDLNQGESISGERILASIALDFDEQTLQTVGKKADGSLTVSPLMFEIEANQEETIFSRSFSSDIDGNQDLAGAYTNRDIKSLADLGGDIHVDGTEVKLYSAGININELDDGLVLGTQRVIGSDANFTNLIRSGDTVSVTTEWLNIGNTDANNIQVTAYNNTNAKLTGHQFVDDINSVKSG